MSEQIWAVIEPGGLVSNVLVADDEFIEGLRNQITDEGVDTGSFHAGQKFVDVTNLDPQPGISWVQKPNGFVRGVVLEVDRDTIPPDSMTAATFTYTDNRHNPPASVDGTVNGEPLTVVLTDGVGSFEVTSANSGDIITIVFPEISLTIEVV